MRKNSMGEKEMQDRLFSDRQLIKLMIPLVIEQGLTILVGMCDGVMVSAVSEAAISGVSLVDMINAVILVLFAALATGGAVVTSQLLGARRTADARRSAGQLVSLTFAMGCLMMALCLIFARGLLKLFFGSIADDVMAAGLIYLRITALSFPFIALYNAGAAIFRSVGNSKVSMQVSLWMNGINVAGNALCVFVLKMGVAGVAVPTLVSRAVAAVMILTMASRKGQELTLDASSLYPIDRQVMGKILRIGIPSACENSFFQFGRLLVVSMIALFGTTQTSANAVANNLDSVRCGPGYGACHGDGGGSERGRRGQGAGHLLSEEGDEVEHRGAGRGESDDYPLPQSPHRPVPLPDASDRGTDPDAGADSLHGGDFYVGFFLCAAQCLPGGQRCPVYHVGRHGLHAGVPGGRVLDSLRAPGLGRCRRVDCHDPGLGVPDQLLPAQSLDRQVAQQDLRKL